MPMSSDSASGRAYTVIGYLDLFNIHTVYEHVKARTSDDAIQCVRHNLERNNIEYRAAREEEIEPLTVIAVFNGHLTEND